MSVDAFFYLVIGESHWVYINPLPVLRMPDHATAANASLGPRHQLRSTFALLNSARINTYEGAIILTHSSGWP